MHIGAGNVNTRIYLVCVVLAMLAALAVPAAATLSVRLDAGGVAPYTPILVTINMSKPLSVAASSTSPVELNLTVTLPPGFEVAYVSAWWNASAAQPNGVYFDASTRTLVLSVSVVNAPASTYNDLNATIVLIPVSPSASGTLRAAYVYSGGIISESSAVLEVNASSVPAPTPSLNFSSLPSTLNITVAGPESLTAATLLLNATNAAWLNATLLGNPAAILLDLNESYTGVLSTSIGVPSVAYASFGVNTTSITYEAVYVAHVPIRYFEAPATRGNLTYVALVETLNSTYTLPKLIAINSTYAALIGIAAPSPTSIGWSLGASEALINVSRLAVVYKTRVDTLYYNATASGAELHLAAADVGALYTTSSTTTTIYALVSIIGGGSGPSTATIISIGSVVGATGYTVRTAYTPPRSELLLPYSLPGHSTYWYSLESPLRSPALLLPGGVVFVFQRPPVVEYASIYGMTGLFATPCVANDPYCPTSLLGADITPLNGRLDTAVTTVTSPFNILDRLRISYNAYSGGPVTGLVWFYAYPNSTLAEAKPLTLNVTEAVAWLGGPAHVKWYWLACARLNAGNDALDYIVAPEPLQTLSVEPNATNVGYTWVCSLLPDYGIPYVFTVGNVGPSATAKAPALVDYRFNLYLYPGVLEPGVYEAVIAINSSSVEVAGVMVAMGHKHSEVLASTLPRPTLDAISVTKNATATIIAVNFTVPAMTANIEYDTLTLHVIVYIPAPGAYAASVESFKMVSPSVITYPVYTGKEAVYTAHDASILQVIGVGLDALLAATQSATTTFNVTNDVGVSATIWANSTLLSGLIGSFDTINATSDNVVITSARSINVTWATPTNKLVIANGTLFLSNGAYHYYTLAGGVEMNITYPYTSIELYNAVLITSGFIAESPMATRIASIYLYNSEVYGGTYRYTPQDIPVYLNTVNLTMINSRICMSRGVVNVTYLELRHSTLGSCASTSPSWLYSNVYVSNSAVVEASSIIARQLVLGGTAVFSEQSGCRVWVNNLNVTGFAAFIGGTLTANYLNVTSGAALTVYYSSLQATQVTNQGVINAYLPSSVSTSMQPYVRKSLDMIGASIMNQTSVYGESSVMRATVTYTWTTFIGGRFTALRYRASVEVDLNHTPYGLFTVTLALLRFTTGQLPGVGSDWWVELIDTAYINSTPRDVPTRVALSFYVNNATVCSGWGSKLASAAHIYYYNVTAGQWMEAQPASISFDPATCTLTAVFNESSKPKASDFYGFLVAAAVPPPPPSPPIQPTRTLPYVAVRVYGYRAALAALNAEKLVAAAAAALIAAVAAATLLALRGCE